MAKHTPAQQLYDLLVSRDFDPELLTSTGKPSEIPSETEIFSFGFQTQQGTNTVNLGHIPFSGIGSIHQL